MTIRQVRFQPMHINQIVSVQVFRIANNQGDIEHETMFKVVGVLKAYTIHKNIVTFKLDSMNELVYNLETHLIEVFDHRELNGGH